MNSSSLTHSHVMDSIIMFKLYQPAALLVGCYIHYKRHFNEKQCYLHKLQISDLDIDCLEALQRLIYHKEDVLVYYHDFS